MTYRPRNPLMGTRIAIYTIAVLAMAWVFWRQDRRQAQMPAAPGKAEEPALQAEPPQGAASPMLVVLTREADQEEGRKLSALAAGDPGLRNAFSVVSVTVVGPEGEEALPAWGCQASDLPLAILFDQQGKEVARGKAPRTLQELEGFRQCLPPSHQAP